MVVVTLLVPTGEVSAVAVVVRIFQRECDARRSKELTKFFLLQVAEASSSHSAPQPRFWVIILLNLTIIDSCH